MLKLDYDLAPVLPEDPDDDVRDEGHDDDEETEQPDWQRREDDGVDSDTNTTNIISVRETENICCRPSRYQMSVRSHLPASTLYYIGEVLSNVPWWLTMLFTQRSKKLNVAK